MSQVNTNAIYDASGGQSAKLYGPSMRYGGTAFVNRIINGDMRIDQRNAGASVTVTSDGQYTLDRWKSPASPASKFTVQQNAGAVTPPAGFTNYLGVTSSSAYSVAAADYEAIQQRIEGFNFSDLGWGTANAQPITISFWVRSSLTGTFGGALYNASANRSYPFTYTVSAANTWEQKTFTVQGDTSGTWLMGTNAGLSLTFGLGVGSTYSGTAGTWAGTLYFSATGATSVVGTNGATFYITGVQLEAGSVASPFERVSYSLQLQQCQRYYWSESIASNQVVDMLSSVAAAPVTQPIAALPVMRAAPTCTAPSVNGSGGMSYSGVHASPNASVLRLNASYTGNGTRVYLIFNSGNFTASAEL